MRRCGAAHVPTHAPAHTSRQGRTHPDIIHSLPPHLPLTRAHTYRCSHVRGHTKFQPLNFAAAPGQKCIMVCSIEEHRPQGASPQDIFADGNPHTVWHQSAVIALFDGTVDIDGAVRTAGEQLQVKLHHQVEEIDDRYASLSSPGGGIDASPLFSDDNPAAGLCLSQAYKLIAMLPHKFNLP